MQPKQALQILTNVVNKYVGTRQDHVLLAEAMELVTKAVSEMTKVDQKNSALEKSNGLQTQSKKRNHSHSQDLSNPA